MELAERDPHLHLLDGLLAETTSGRGRVVLLEGPIASGRTALLRALADRAAAAGFSVLNATCCQAEQALPLGMVSQIFRNAKLPPPFAHRVTGLLCEGAPLASVARSHADLLQPDMVKVFHGLSVTLLDVANERPILIAIDDLQHADTSSLYCLLHLVRRVRSARIIAVLTDNTHQHRSHDSCRAELLRQPHLYRIPLAPLSDDGVTTMARQRLDHATADRLAPDLRAATGGNPLLLRALLDDHAEFGEARQNGYGQALLSCLHRADPMLLRAVRAVAVLDDGAPGGDVGELLGADDEDVARALRELDTAGLLDGRRLRHPVARDAVLDDLPVADRRALHERAARLRHEQGAPAMTIARHMLDAGRDPEPWATCALVEAAEQALVGEQDELAVSCLELAHRCAQNERDQALIRARLAQAEWRLNPATAARHLPPLSAAVTAGHLDGHATITLIRQLLWHGHTSEAATALNRLRTSVAGQHTEDSAELHDIEAWLALTHPPLARRRPAPSPATGQDALVRPRSDPWLHATAAMATCLTRGQWTDSFDNAHQGLRGVHLSRDTGWAEEAVPLALLVLTLGGHADTAAEECDRLLADATSRGMTTWQALLASAKADIASRTGDLTEAVAQAREALTRLAAKSWGVAVGMPLGILILAATRMGNYDDAALHLTYSVPDALFESRYGLGYLYARGHYHLATNRYHAALADFLSCGELARRWGLDLAGLVPWRTSASEAWLRLGNRDQARRLVHDQLARPDVDDARTRGESLRLLSTVSPASRRPQLLTEALDLAEDSGDRFEQARVLADLSRAYRALEKNRQARMVFRRAFHVAKMCEAQPLVQELLSVNDPVVVPDGSERLNSLTDSERRVASLAVMGYTNHEIALKLYITPSTVEQHLTRVYRKLNVKGRKDLPADMGTPRIRQPR